jgi:hypothetical protein
MKISSLFTRLLVVSCFLVFVGSIHGAPPSKILGPFPKHKEGCCAKKAVKATPYRCGIFKKLAGKCSSEKQQCHREGVEKNATSKSGGQQKGACSSDPCGLKGKKEPAPGKGCCLKGKKESAPSKGCCLKGKKESAPSKGCCLKGKKESAPGKGCCLKGKDPKPKWFFW